MTVDVTPGLRGAPLNSETRPRLQLDKRTKEGKTAMSYLKVWQGEAGISLLAYDRELLKRDSGDLEYRRN